ncbi:MAG TPA: ABC transporter family substrate-binding protein, partial [Microlunatus sp.]|nr:ABC transporter family substrate-binding protein [Microlunatus sp.]
MKGRKLLVAVPLVTGALVLAACGGGGSSQTPGGEQSQSASLAPMTSVDINAKDRASLKQGGELRLAIGAFAPSWNFLNVNGNESDMSGPQGVEASLYPNIISFDDKGTPTANPNYLVSAQTTQDKPTVAVFKFKPEAKWGDGTQVGAADMIAMWKACNGANDKFQCASTDGFDQVSKIDANTDGTEATVTFKDAFPDWSQPFSTLAHAPGLKDPQTFNNGWTDPDNNNMAGPFKVDKFDKTQQVITLVPNDKWWGEKPLLDKVSFRVIAIDATPNAFVNNEIDSFDIGADPNGYQQASKVTDGTIRKAAGPNWRHITFNAKTPVLSDQNVRQAMLMGLDRVAIGESDLAGVDWPFQELNNGIFLSNQTGYVDMGQKTGLDYNVEKAKTMLDDAGWKAGADGIREKDGKKLEVKFTTLDGVAASQNEGLQTQNQLKDLGIKVDIVNISPDKFSTTLSGHEFELIAFTWVGTPYPFANIYQLYGTKSASNYQQISIPEVDKLTEEIKVETNPQKRIDLANQAAELTWKSVGILPLYQRPS